MITAIALFSAALNSAALAQDEVEAVPPEERFRIIAVSSDEPLPEVDPYAEAEDAAEATAAPVTQPLALPGLAGAPIDAAALEALMAQLAGGQIPTLDPSMMQDPSALLNQLPPEIRANMEAMQRQLTEQAEDAAREAGEAVKTSLENPGQPPR